MTRSGKKRIRSKNSSPEQESNRKKKTKSVKDYLTDKVEMEMESMSSPILPSKPAETDERAEPRTPCERLNFEVPDCPISPDTPGWAQDLINSVNALKKELVRVCTIAEETKDSMTGILNKSTELTNKLGNISRKVVNIERESASLRLENTEMKEKLLLLEFHQRRNNLIFDGIEEEAEGHSETGFDCYEKIMSCLRCIPGLNTHSIRIDRCHRLGPKQRFRNRSIIAKINWYGDLVEILRGRSHLPHGVFVSEDLPDEWNNRRRLLRPILARAKELPKYRDSSYISRDKLFINGTQFTVSPINNLCDLPPEIIPSDTCEKKNETTIAFFGPHSVFSNFHSASFIENQVRYNCSEQMIQAEKAAMFGDKVALQQIMKESDPYKIKGLGSRVKGFKRETWEDKCKSIALRAVRAKFQQNASLGKVLKCTGSLKIVEASKDTVWGTGVHLKDQNTLVEGNWHGPGLMCEILSDVRRSLSVKV